VKHTLPCRALLTLAALCATSASALATGSSGSGSVSIASPAGVTQNFDTLSNSTSPSSLLPTGWYLTETGTGAAADGLYVVGTGSSNAGGAYSFGAAAAIDRAFGSLGSGTVTPVQYGAQFTNNTGSVISSITLAYAGEMWRRGTATASAGEGLTFAYSTDATSLTTGTFTPVATLNFASPGDTCSVTQNVATVGNSANCRQAINATISGLSIPNGQTFWIRWTDTDTGGSDDGVAIDDVAITVGTSTISISPTATGSASPSPVGPGQQTTLSGTITAGQNPNSLSYAVSCDLSAIGGSSTQALPVTGATFSFVATVGASVPPTTYVLPCSVIDDQVRATNFTISVTVLIPINSTCGSPATPIDAVQGAGATSPLAGQTVDLEGIVVGAFQGSALLNGFYLEQDAATQDGDANTSEGIFVFASTPAVNVGDRVRIRGVVNEFPSATGTLVSNLTELGSTSNATVCSTGNGLPAPVTITLPVDSLSALERYEGMLVQFTQQLVVTGEFSLGTFGQIDLAPSVLFQPTQSADSSTWASGVDLNKRSLISLDDDSTLSNANLNGGGLAPYPSPGLTAANTLRAGALVNATGGTPTPLTGILDDRFGSYRIQPTAAITFSNASNPRPNTSAVVASLGGRFRVASANVLNFFTTLGSRGAATAQELTNQRIKVIAELSKLNGDVYGLSEVQNFANGNTSGGTYTNAAASDLATNLATATGRNYQFVDSINPANVVGGDITQNGTDAIRNVILYDASRVTPVGSAALYYQNDTNRPSLAQTFKPASGAKADSQTFTVVVNHFRSKGSACGGANDDPLQGTCNGVRLLMAHNVQAWLAGNPTSDPAGANRKYLLIGDFNAYFGEDPIQSFLGATGYTDLINLLLGANAYSYNFGSQSGYLDHALVNAAFLPLIKTTAELHINADEPAALEALDSALKSPAAQTAYFGADEFAASDHDPFVVVLNPLAGDLNDDGVVDLADRNIIVANYGKAATQVDRRLDYDGDGVISPNDYRLWLNLYRAFIQ
jgi:predicted extracellular nuclease